MRLIDLDPRWVCLESGAPRVGLSFECPHCRKTRLAVCFHHDGFALVDDGYILANHGAPDAQHIWNLSGQEDFATLTLSPSIDASAAGHWHGFIQDGNVT